jgi:hypothetical protein
VLDVTDDPGPDLARDADAVDVAVLRYEGLRRRPPVHGAGLLGAARASGTRRFTPVDELPGLAFNHNDLISRGNERVRGKASYSSLPALLMPRHFTHEELQLMYETVLGRPFDQTNLGRRVTELDILEAVDPGTHAAKETVARSALRGKAGRRPRCGGSGTGSS